MHPGLWITLGLALLGAYVVSHRRSVTAQAAQLQYQEAATPLQPFTQPQPPRSALNWEAYGLVPFGVDAQTSSKPKYQVAYSSPYGALV